METPHVSTSDSDIPPEIPEYSGYDELKTALLSLIEQHTMVQTLRLTDYSGNVDQDVRRVVREVMKAPIAAFAVSNISYQSAQILSYYEIQFDISYRRQAQEMDSIREIGSREELSAYLREKMAQFSPTILFSLSDYSKDYAFAELFSQIYYENPELAYGAAVPTVQFFPETGAQRIVEMTVRYGQLADTLHAKSATATEEAQIILDAYSGSLLTVNRIQYFHDTLVSTVTPDRDSAPRLESGELTQKGDPFTVYGALIKKNAVSEGFALAFQQLCMLSDIDCMVVCGKRDGIPYYWNLVLYRGKWSHVDCYESALHPEEPYRGFGLTDEALSETHSWDTTRYPASDSSLLREMLSLDFPTHETEAEQ
ncbi:MAG: hypothetical protein E7458_09275 [Ruminococcaceae bacterium]|nr:hypothetical protein [Oscillospiraceae bacterium]